jgi:hypothetical protein
VRLYRPGRDDRLAAFDTVASHAAEQQADVMTRARFGNVSPELLDASNDRFERAVATTHDLDILLEAERAD